MTHNELERLIGQRIWVSFGSGYIEGILQRHEPNEHHPKHFAVRVYDNRERNPYHAALYFDVVEVFAFRIDDMPYMSLK